ncbi:MAG: phosphoribulokinase [Anaerolineales bacterium]|jgi:phosphoribulokinase|nr:phosphoribulokinase [Anaerolineales bacterium]
MNKQRPIILAIVGDSAAGKSTLTNGLVQILGEDRVTVVCTDDYHKYDRKERAELGITPLHPDCNYIDVLELHLERLHYGQPFLKPVYDHSSGSLVRPEYVRPREFVIVEGLLGFHSAVMRQFYDVKVFLDPPEDLRTAWKIKRDTSKRGYTADQVRAEMKKREADTLNYIRPQREHADIVVRFHPDEGVGSENAGPTLNAQLVLRPTIPHPDLSYLIDGTPHAPTDIRLRLGRDGGRPVDFLEITGGVSAENAFQLEDAIWQHLPDLRPVREDLFGDYQDRTEIRHSHPLALSQLLITYHLLHKYVNIKQIPMAPPVAALSRLQSTPESTLQSPGER